MTKNLKKNILVVDDDQDMCRELADILSDEGYAVSCAFDGIQAGDCLQRTKFDLVLLDLKMPKRDGISVLQEIKKSWPGTKVIVISGSLFVTKLLKEDQNKEKEVRQGILRSADGIMNKPFRIDEVLENIKTILA